ncbi:hypothetical protein [Carnobacterium mobile]|uniref:hypothetical protein n=1 Tax=Carnobacterium mobile TaxID=2750 RepID=UPI001D02FD53|nr:hypothetical protein [Carnobacterium mobile]
MLIFIIYVVLSTSGLILFKLGSSNLSIGITKTLFSMHIPFLSLLGLLCYLFSFLLWMYIISKSEISFIVPLGVAITNLAILAGSYYILDETISVTTIIGTILIISGVIVMNIHLK